MIRSFHVPNGVLQPYSRRDYQLLTLGLLVGGLLGAGVTVLMISRRSQSRKKVPQRGIEDRTCQWALPTQAVVRVEDGKLIVRQATIILKRRLRLWTASRSSRPSRSRSSRATTYNADKDRCA